MSGGRDCSDYFAEPVQPQSEQAEEDEQTHLYLEKAEVSLGTSCCPYDVLHGTEPLLSFL